MFSVSKLLRILGLLWHVILLLFIDKLLSIVKIASATIYSLSVTDFTDYVNIRIIISRVHILCKLVLCIEHFLDIWSAVALINT
jgi:hypothetical protein